MRALELSFFETPDFRFQISEDELQGSLEHEVMKLRTHNFKRLDVWQRARTLVKDIYRITAFYPDTEKFGLTSQTRRCAVSIPSNIAEGCGRNSNKQMIHFCSIARGSAFELETQLILGQDLEFLKDADADQLLKEISEIQRMLDGLIATIERKSVNQQ